LGILISGRTNILTNGANQYPGLLVRNTNKGKGIVTKLVRPISDVVEWSLVARLVFFVGEKHQQKSIRCWYFSPTTEGHNRL